MTNPLHTKCKSYTTKILCHLCGDFFSQHNIIKHITTCVADAEEPIPYEKTKTLFSVLLNSDIKSEDDFVLYNSDALDTLLRFSIVSCQGCGKYLSKEMKHLHSRVCFHKKNNKPKENFSFFYKQKDHFINTKEQSKRELWKMKNELINKRNNRSKSRSKGIDGCKTLESKRRLIKAENNSLLPIKIINTNSKKQVISSIETTTLTKLLKRNKSKSEKSKKRRSTKKDISKDKPSLSKTCNAKFNNNTDEQLFSFKKKEFLNNGLTNKISSFEKKVVPQIEQKKVLKVTKSPLKKTIDKNLFKDNKMKSFKKNKFSQNTRLKSPTLKALKKRSKLVIPDSFSVELNKSLNQVNSTIQNIEYERSIIHTKGKLRRSYSLKKSLNKKRKKMHSSMLASPKKSSKKDTKGSKRVVKGYDFNDFLRRELELDTETFTQEYFKFTESLICCQYCKRNFAGERIAKHEKVCLKNKKNH